MTNREALAFSLGFSEHSDEEVADIISDCLISITDDEDISVAVICGNDKRLLAEWLGKESE